jgi:hypothetical protein
VLALGGGFLGQWWGEGRAVAREQRDRDHEREVWARDLRRKDHMAFIAEFERKLKTIDQRQLIPYDDGSEPDPDVLESITDKMTAMRLFTDTATYRRARDVIVVLRDYIFGSDVGPVTRLKITHAFKS